MLPPSEIQKLRQKHYLTISASLFEVFGYTVLEAMSQGCPIVTSDAGGIPELINHDINGLLFSAGDADDLTARIQQMLDNPTVAKSLGSKALEDSRDLFSPSRSAVFAEDVYRQEIAKFSRKDLTYWPDQHEFY